MALPRISLSGTPYEQGVAHGRALRDRIAHNLSIYFERFARETLLERAAVLEIARRYGVAIATQNAGYAAGMQGIADGSGFTLDEIAALNVRYEILYYQFGKLAMANAVAAAESPGDGCTAFALRPEVTADGHLLMGQNWDWIPEVQGAVLHTTETDGFETLAYTEAGIVGAKIGLNAAGLGLAINGITTTDDDWSRLAKPFHVRCYEILRSRRFDDARTIVTEGVRSCSSNFLIAQAPGRIADLEAAPDRVQVLECRDGCLTHANHFVDPDGLGIVEPPNDRRIYSKRRAERLRALLLDRTPVTVDGIQDALRDTRDDPFGICRHRDPSAPPEQHYVTVTAVVMDLDTRTLHLTDGPPDEGAFETHRL